MAQFKKASRSAFLNSIRKAFVLHKISSQPGAPSAVELLQMSMEDEHSLPRRKFLNDMAKAGIIIGTAGFLESCRKVERFAGVKKGQSGNSVNENYRIAIIGAGIAGLNCAYQLKKAGYYSTVYEASTRTGGRMLSKNNFIGNGLNVELGGEFIDSGHKHMLALAKEFNLNLLDTQAKSEKGLEDDVFYIAGQFYSEAQIVAAFAPYASQIASDLKLIPDNFGFNNFTADVQRFDQMSISGYFDTLGMPSGSFLRKGLEEAYLTEYGREVNDQTAINFLFLFSINPANNQYEIFGASDERYKVDGGNQRIPDAIYDEIADQVELGASLTKITQNNSGVYKLFFANGTTVSADIVVVTIPFTMLKDVDLSSLNFPSWKTNAIQNLGYGTNAKLLMGFNKRTWRDKGYAGGVFTTGSTSGATTYIQTGWDNSRMQGGNKGGFTVYQGGNQGLNLSLAQSGIFLSQLEAMWQGTSAQYNGTSKLIHWPTHPFTKASYACWRVGQVTTISGAEILPIDNIYFAGEHTSAWNQGYMEGGAETGAKAAKDIVKALKGTQAI
ncbi:MAG: FAD-dependent oxidoreductase [Bacteroidetes bacterium]|nr:FAD-dependent oxidoreductase [Bacteroidota bacterium]